MRLSPACGRQGWLAVLVFPLVLGVACAQQPAPPQVDPLEQDVTQGALRVQQGQTVVECPLTHTDVQMDISGFIARATVTQTFTNPFTEKIEAVYVFPLPHTAAVDGMTMVIGERRVQGLIKRRADARALYERAMAQGYTASLLEQERPNIFRQSVGNIRPGQAVKIEITYLDVLKYEGGAYEAHFPMVVGPRYNPAKTLAAPRPGGAMNAAPAEPPVLAPGTRSGHDVSLRLHLEAGVPIQNLRVVNHQAQVERVGESEATVTLDPADAMPNKDFVFRYYVRGALPEMAVLATQQDSQGYFMLMIQPYLNEKFQQAPPRELVFLVDISGSMSGAPTEKVKQTMRAFFARCHPDDTIQVIPFASQSFTLFEQPVPASEEHIAKALAFNKGYQAGGGTEMLTGVKLALDAPADPRRVRVVVMLTDGYIGNEAEIIKEVGTRTGDRVKFWAFGIGAAPNRFLIDGVAKAGQGGSAVIDLPTDPSATVDEAMDKIHRAQFSQIAINWKGLGVYEMYPRQLPDLWLGRPVILYGRYTRGGRETIALTGTVEGEPVTYTLPVDLPETNTVEHAVLAKVWARQKIEDLGAMDFYQETPAIVEEITQVALAYGLMSQYTSLVAVDEEDIPTLEEQAPPRRVLVPVPLPDGTRYAGFFGGGAYQGEGLRGFMDAWEVHAPVLGRLPAPAGRPRPGATIGVRFTTPEALMYKLAGPRGPQRPVGALGPMMLGGMPTTPPPPQMAPMQPPFSFDTVNGIDGSFRLQHSSLSISKDAYDKMTAGAKLALAQARAAREKGAPVPAMAHYQQAFLLGASLEAGGAIPAATTTELGQVAIAYSDMQAKLQPRLQATMQLVIRDQSLEEAAGAVAAATGLQLSIIAGSLDDARALRDGRALRVVYLDLRAMPAAQALDELLTPFHLTWRTTGTTLQVGTARRMDARTVPWIYPVSGLVLPLARETKNLDAAKARALVEKGHDQLLDAARKVTRCKDQSGTEPGSVLWQGPGLLYVYGDKAVHARIEALLAALREAKAPLPAGITLPAGMRLTMATRWAERAPERARLQAAMEQAELLSECSKGTWPLLDAAARGQADDEASTRLRVALTSPALGAVLKSEARFHVLRALWAATQAARLVTGDETLDTLAKLALEQSAAPTAASLARLANEPADDAAALGVLYGMLAARNAREIGLPVPAALSALQERGIAAVTALDAEQPRVVQAIAASLLAPTASSDARLGAAITDQALRGNDLIALGARAAEARGGALWTRFRQEMPALLGAQPLDGHVILYVNRLSARAPITL